MYGYLLILQVAGGYPSPDNDKTPRTDMFRNMAVGGAAMLSAPALSRSLNHHNQVFLKMSLFLVYAAWFSTYQMEWEANLIPSSLRSVTRTRMNMLSEDPKKRAFYTWVAAAGVESRLNLHGSLRRIQSMRRAAGEQQSPRLDPSPRQHPFAPPE